MKRAALVLTSLGIVALAVACGGAQDTEVFSSPGSSGFGTEPTPAGGGLSSGGSAAGTPASSSGGSSSGGASSSSGGSSSSGSSSSSGGSSSGGSSSGGSSSGGYTDPGIWCGQRKGGAAVYCSPATQVCCAEDKDGDMHFSCVPAGTTACSSGTPIRCDDQADCPGGRVCCGTFERNTGYLSLQCQASCTPPMPPLQSVRFCDPDAPVDECQSIGKSCMPSDALPEYSVCD